jgi:carbon monoxide dehydrogenase subunit G
VKMTGSRAVAAPIDVVWAALNDPAVIKACVSGCESIEPETEDTYRMVVAQQIGPISARFTGTMRVQDAVPPSMYTLRFDGSGAAGFVKGEARVSLSPNGTQATALSYEANAQIGGKLAQIGSRLVDAVATRQTDDFFSRFETIMAERAAPIAPVGTSSVPVTAQPSHRSTKGFVTMVVVLGVVALAVWALIR